MKTLQALHEQMQSEYTTTAKFFGEDPSMTSTEEFFGIFSTFLDQFEVGKIVSPNKQCQVEQVYALDVNYLELFEHNVRPRE